MVDTKIWWKELPCHYHPSWNLHKIQQKDLNTLKVYLDRDKLNDFLVVERYLYAAYLEVPVGSFYNLSLPRISQALSYLQLAEEYVEDIYNGDEDAKVGYGIVINACRMWISQSTREWEKKLQGWMERRENYPDSVHYVSAVRAFTLSKLGPEWLQEAHKYYEKAIKGIPDKSEWVLETTSLAVQLAQRKDPKMDPVESVKMLTKAESLVSQALQFDKDFHAARALLVQILFALRRPKEAETEAKKFTPQIIKSTVMTNTAEVLCKYYIQIKEYRKATDVITKVPHIYRAAEEHFLRGFLNKLEAESHPDRENTKWSSALLDAERAIKLDARHYRALCLQAEMNAKLRNFGAAKEHYTDLLSSNLLDKPQLCKEKFHALESVLSLHPDIRKEILTDEECINYAGEFLTAGNFCKEIDFNDSAEVSVDKCKSTLREMYELEDTDNENRFLAKLKLAHFHLQLKQYTDARPLYSDLRSQTSLILRENVEVMWGLFKCDLGEGLYESAEQLVKDIKEENQTFYRIEELYADIYTTTARSQLELLNDKSAEVFVSKEKEDDDPPSIARSLEQAIEMGSLEACFMFFTIDKLRKHFLQFMRIPRIVAKIQRVNNEEIENVHTDFPIERFVTDRECSITSKRNILKENIEELLKSCESKEKGFTPYQNFTISNVYKKLSKLRKYRLKFEVVVAKKSEGTVWNEECEDAFSWVLLTARFLLDHITSDYQDALIKEDGDKPNSYFCFIYDHKNGTVTDKERATSKLDDWLKSKFPKCHVKISYEVKKSLLEMQPMYDINKNRWLVDMNNYVNTLQHRGGRKGKKERSTETDKTALSDLPKDENKENLARKSCKEVEKIVLQILDAIKEIYKSANQEE